MKGLRSPQLWIGLVSAVFVVFLAVVSMGRTSPGPLSGVHERVEGLSSKSGCADCHGGWRTSMSQACLECHEAVDEHIQAGRGLHGVLEDGLVQRCARCHSDHHGPSFAVVNPQSFREAGVPDVELFEHERVGFPMDGAHLELDCTECHENAEAALLPEGAHRFIGLDQNCASCHDDPHEGRMALSCTKCHGQEAFDTLATFDHDRYLPISGGHAQVGCRECHVEGEPSSFDVVGQHRIQPAPRDCLACHESPHEERFMGEVAAQLGRSVGQSCASCHAAEHISFRDEALEMTPAQHAHTGFGLERPHAGLDCTQCHSNEASSEGQPESFERRFPGRGADDCASCHDDPHGGQFAEGPFSVLGCVACHDRERFEPHAFAEAQHALTSLPLDGAHLDAECSACHQRSVDGDAIWPREFRGTPARCEACHDDAHAGFFEGREPPRPAAAAIAAERGDCALCHLTESFDALPPEGFAHGPWTGFALVGAHREESCESCHPLSPEADDLGRRFGRVAEHFGAVERCTSCHEDPHEGGFDVRGLPRKVQGREDCLRCHVESSFRAFPDGFDHHKWTAFPLKGAHGKLDCSDCHEPLRRPTEIGRTWGRAAGSACADCHADPHGGQFEVDGRIDCARCHRSTASFAALSFNHEIDSRFPLGAAHEELACAECHQAVHQEDGGYVRYRPLRMQCTDCHGVHLDPLRRRSGR